MESRALVAVFREADFHPNSRSQSRMRGDYLFYEEKLEATQEERDLKAARRCVSFIYFCLVFAI
jgi:hypothetical protein